jgi:hypothetical protein
VEAEEKETEWRRHSGGRRLDARRKRLHACGGGGNSTCQAAYGQHYCIGGGGIMPGGGIGIPCNPARRTSGGPLSISYGRVGCLEAKALPPPV